MAARRCQLCTGGCTQLAQAMAAWRCQLRTGGCNAAVTCDGGLALPAPYGGVYAAVTGDRPGAASSVRVCAQLAQAMAARCVTQLSALLCSPGLSVYFYKNP